VISDLEARVWDAESRLWQAQIDHDVRVIDELISPELLFTGHVGQMVTKDDDLGFHREPTLHLTSITPVEKHIRLHDGFAVVSVLLHLIGTFEGAPIDQHMRYTRVWAPSEGGSLQVVAGHMSEVRVG
jgi:hypothetical protein